MKGYEGMQWIKFVHYRIQWQAVVSTAMNFRVSF
jgi:hypothetical protein